MGLRLRPERKRTSDVKTTMDVGDTLLPIMLVLEKKKFKSKGALNSTTLPWKSSTSRVTITLQNRDC